MRTLPALLALLAPAVVAPLLLAAASARDWTQMSTRLPNGAYLLGNPAARVKLVEYGSYTCPHCAAFAAQSRPTLRDRWVRDGSVSLELHHLIRDSADLAAVVVARCTGARFFATSDLIFARQPQWLDRAFSYQQTNASRINLYPPLARLRAIADGSGLTDIGRAQGLTDARLDACFADQAGIDRLVAATGEAKDVEYTPTFFLDGKKVDGADWTKLEPLLRARGLQ